ncbi:MAG: TIR domain-containing protein [Granulosicoccus sp.]
MSLYNIDLFISYAHIDNQPLVSGASGWISRFHESLDTLLSMRLGKRVRIWRDDKLQGNDRFADEIVNQFDSTAVLISVLSPRYLKSEWCTREVDEFCNRAQSRLFIDQKARVFKILKTPIDTECSLPSIMQELLGYEFFVFEDGVPLELDGVYGQQYEQSFNRKVNKLAFEIAELLKQLESNIDEAGNAATNPEKTKPVVYLAECTFDMKQKREAIETELKCLGYKVLPDRQLPRDEAEYSDTVRALLQQSDVSVHLIGQQYGAVPDGPNDESIAFIQNRIAAEQCQQSALARLIWLEAGVQSSDDKQQSFIEALQSDAQAQEGADLLTGNIESLKTTLQRLLEKIENDIRVAVETTSGESSNSDAENRSLYLICTERDRKATVPVRKYLRERGVSVSMPAFKGDAAEVRQINQQLITESATIIVFYGEGEEAWKRSIDTELRKLPAYLEGRQPPAVFTYLAAPLTWDKEDIIDMDETGVINGVESLAEKQLDAVFQRPQSLADIT